MITQNMINTVDDHFRKESTKYMYVDLELELCMELNLNYAPG